MATAVEVSDVALRYVTEAERCPHPTHTHQNIACDYCKPFPCSLKLYTYPPSMEKIKTA